MSRIASPVPAALAARPQLEVRDLELVLALASSGTTVSAARALHVTQSAVSRALGQAEDRLGVRLFERGARGLRPTSAGERLIAGASKLLVELKELERQLVRPAPHTRLRLVCECYTAYHWLPSTMAALRTALPGLALEVATEHTRDPVPALLDGKLDVALLTTSSTGAHATRGAFIERPLLTDEVVFLLAASHPLAAARSLTRADLRAHPLITSRAPAAATRWFLSSVFGRRPPQLDFLVLPLTEAIIDATRAGMGIAVLSEWMASASVASGDLLVKRLVSGALRRPWRIAYRRELAGVVDPLVLALTSAAPQLGRVPATRVARLDPGRARRSRDRTLAP